MAQLSIPVYSVTMGYWGKTLPAQAIKDLVDLTSGHPERICLRYQAPMSKVTADPSIYDIAVKACNDAGIPIYLECKRFDGSPGGPVSAASMTTFATQIATRYDGKHGHGKADIIGIGNEDYQYSDFKLLADTMVMCYQKLKNINPDLLILPGCTLQRNERDMRAAVTTLLQTAGKSVDGLTFHTYYGIPSTGSHRPDDGSVANTPSFPQCVAALKEVCVKTGYPHMGLYNTEYGFASTKQNHGNVLTFSEQDQAKHMLYCLDQARTLGVKMMSWFTLAYPNPPTPPDGMSLVLGGHQTIAYQQMKVYIAKYPTWGNGTPLPPDPPPPTNVQQAITLLGQAKLETSVAGNALIDQAIALIQS